jgi:hypothetical protein
MNLKRLLKLANSFFLSSQEVNGSQLKKTAFFEAPPVLLEKLYKMYEDMYNAHVEYIVSYYKNIVSYYKNFYIRRKSSKRKDFIEELRAAHEYHPSKFWYDEDGNSITEQQSRELYKDKRYDYMGLEYPIESFGNLPPNYLSELKDWYRHLRKNGSLEIDHGILFIKEKMKPIIDEYVSAEEGSSKRLSIQKKYFDTRYTLPTIANKPSYLPDYSFEFYIKDGPKIDLENATDLDKPGFKVTFKIYLGMSKLLYMTEDERQSYKDIISTISYYKLNSVNNSLNPLSDNKIDYLKNIKDLFQSLRYELPDEHPLPQRKDISSLLIPENKLNSSNIYSSTSDDLKIIGYQFLFKDNKTMSAEYTLQKKDLSGWRWSHLVPKYLYSRLPKISLFLTVGPTFKDAVHKTVHYGSLTQKTNELPIKIGIPCFTEEHIRNNDLLKKKTKEDLTNIKDILNHELGHYFQFLGGEPNKFIGLPPKVKGKKKHNVRGVDSSGSRTQPHQFRAIEFYPRLGDSLIRFRRKISSVPEEKKSQFIKDFIGANGINQDTDINFKSIISGMKSPYELKVYQNMVKAFLSEIERS